MDHAYRRDHFNREVGYHREMYASMPPVPSSRPPITIQVPQFMYTGPPTLAPGGGAEVLAPGMLSDGSWMENNGFSSVALSSYSTLKNYNTVPAPQETVEEMQRESRSAPFDFPSSSGTSPASMSSPPAPLVQPAPVALTMPISTVTFASVPSAPSALGLPVYSTSGFDVLSVLARIATRPNPTVTLGPVDLTSSFVVVDVRRHDHPIVYCSPTFCQLTGYPEREILGRNCRFLQSPGGRVKRGEQRQYTSNEAVAHLKKSLSADKECQTSIVNYRKDGGAFINLVTVIPIRGGFNDARADEDEVVYHVGFQVDLTEQPNAILEKLKDGSYIVNYPPQNMLHPLGDHLQTLMGSTKKNFIPSLVMSSHLKAVLQTTSDSNEKTEDGNLNHSLSLALLSHLPDFFLVVSLKGAFLYVAPAVQHVLGYTAEELIGKALGDICHAADVVPLMRELKESSTWATSSHSQGESSKPADSDGKPKTVDLLFRAQTKAGVHVWMECRGRLHVEPGKGRKAIVLCARTRSMASLSLSSTSSLDGLWGTIDRDGIILMVGSGHTRGQRVGLRDEWGWLEANLVGKPLTTVLEGVDSMLYRGGGRGRGRVRTKDGGSIDVEFVLYDTGSSPSNGVGEPPMVYQIIPLHSAAVTTIYGSAYVSASGAGPPAVSGPAGAVVALFADLDTSRASSWQYELQQLRFANQRLLEEIRALEDERGMNMASPTSSFAPSSCSSPYPVTGASFGNPFAQYANVSGYAATSPPINSGGFYSTDRYLQANAEFSNFQWPTGMYPGVKRSWDHPN
ncbi:blue light receptor [Armillaria novae-zelandiae]|uniref:Blue light receptor n=1 Tax=Armillaria novae-zelandiae TaxID=153914 RepID=A0AA39U3R3_9AGAR|nr:blue light receptor [Armillaria novae-zelandiae]